MCAQFLVDRDVQRKGVWNLACVCFHTSDLCVCSFPVCFSRNSTQGFVQEAPWSASLLLLAAFKGMNVLESGQLCRPHHLPAALSHTHTHTHTHTQTPHPHTHTHTKT